MYCSNLILMEIGSIVCSKDKNEKQGANHVRVSDDINILFLDQVLGAMGAVLMVGKGGPITVLLSLETTTLNF